MFRFFGESLRQAGILIIGSTTVIWGLVFLIGLGGCGIQAGYFNQSTGTPNYAGVFAAWCNLREAVPLVFGYMMSAKVGTGIVAELGAMRISEEIDALEVMGVDSMVFLCATRLLATWIVLPFMYITAIGVAFLASYLAIVDQLGFTSSGGFLLIFWQFQNPTDFLFSVLKGTGDGDGDRARGVLLRLQRQWWACRGGQGDREVDGAKPNTRERDRRIRHPDLLGHQRAGPDRRLRMATQEPVAGTGRARGRGASTAFHTGRSAPPMPPTRSSSSRSTSRSGATTCCAG